MVSQFEIYSIRVLDTCFLPFYYDPFQQSIIGTISLLRYGKYIVILFSPFFVQGNKERSKENALGREKFLKITSLRSL